MKYGFNLPPMAALADARLLGELAHEAEDAGWDGFYLWDHVTGWNQPTADPWICLAAAALATSTIRLGTLVTPLARRRPQKLARETATLDRLSNGRLTLGVGLGIHPEEFGDLGDEADPIVRGEMLDEALEALTGLWTGEPFSYEGKHYHVKNALFQPSPVQQPRIPVWVAGTWPNKRPFRRASAWDGVFPIYVNFMERGLTPDDFREIVSYTMKHRTADGPFDVLHGGSLPKDPAAARDFIQPFAEAGVTWWMEGAMPGDDLGYVRDTLHRGPPRA